MPSQDLAEKLRTLERLADRLVPYRTLVIGAIHFLLIVLASYLAIQLRFDGEVPQVNYRAWSAMLPWLIAIRALIFVPFRLYEGLWRYTSIWDALNIGAAVVSSSLLFYIVAHLVFGETAYPRSVIVVDSLLLMLFTGGIRLTRRIYRELEPGRQDKTVLIYGAGDAGDMIVREMRHSAFYPYDPIGFIDDDRAKVGRRIRGVPVLGSRENLARIIKERRPDEILIAIPTAQPAVMRGILRSLEPFKVPIKTLPNLRDVLDGRVTVQQIRNLAVEDLLVRVPVGLDPSPLSDLIAGRRVLVTGAGGSIGSELCRQIAAFAPASLVLLERYENSLYAIDNDLRDRGHGSQITAVIGDVTDAARVTAVLNEHRPHIVFHAAAHKHVPLMELNPCEAVKNNVAGTRVMARAAAAAGVSRFVLISSDKAVRPSSVMGTTKRVAELIVQSEGRDAGTTFMSVRFGNVLGSNGSVVPRFVQQIAAGGPVTVTHPDMRRYFMLISEACQLVLHAAARGEGGIYVLEMGEQLSILDLARDLIRLSGFVPEDIEIVFTGLRPGEKLSEELIGAEEVLDGVILDKIQRVASRSALSPDVLNAQLDALESVARSGDTVATLAALGTIVPMNAALEPASQPTVEPVSVGPPEPADVAESFIAGGLPVPCPVCRSVTHPSRTRNPIERFLRTWRTSRLYRCPSCGWRGWAEPTGVVSAIGPEEPAGVNFATIDESIARPAPETFVPKRLE